MQYFYVYRIDRKTESEIPLGVIFERRKEERGFNYIGMLHLARREFGTPSDSKDIFISNYKYAQSF